MEPWGEPASTNQNIGNYHLFKKYVHQQGPDFDRAPPQICSSGEEQTEGKTSIGERQQDTPCNCIQHKDPSILPVVIIDRPHVSNIKNSHNEVRTWKLAAFPFAGI